MRFDPADAMADLADLLEAHTADELHRALVLGVPAHRANEPLVPVGLLRRVHADHAERVGETVLLLATDPRWERAVDLMDALAATGVVDGEVLDLLAQAFIQADEHVWWHCPDDWFDGEVVIELGDEAAAGKSSAAEEPAGAGPTVVRRRVPPAVRRWAVRRLVAQQPSRWGPVLQLATAAPTKVAAPILLGLLDGEDSLTVAAADLVREAAIASSDATVRMAGLRHLAAADRDAALARAAADSNARVRRWGESLAAAAAAAAAQPGHAPDEDTGAEAVGGLPAEHGNAAQDGRGTLF